MAFVLHSAMFLKANRTEIVIGMVLFLRSKMGRQCRPISWALGSVSPSRHAMFLRVHDCLVRKCVTIIRSRNPGPKLGESMWRMRWTSIEPTHEEHAVRLPSGACVAARMPVHAVVFYSTTSVNADRCHQSILLGPPPGMLEPRRPIRRVIAKQVRPRVRKHVLSVLLSLECVSLAFVIAASA